MGNQPTNKMFSSASSRHMDKDKCCSLEGKVVLNDDNCVKMQ